MTRLIFFFIQSKVLFMFVVIIRIYDHIECFYYIFPKFVPNKINTNQSGEIEQ